MKVLISNPFRLLGVLSNCSEREIQKNKSKLKAYLDVDKQAELDNEFPCLGNIYRDEEKIDGAISALEINKSKLLYALFWFLDANHLDDPAFQSFEKRKYGQGIRYLVESDEFVGDNF